jgi:hypothetical protein
MAKQLFKLIIGVVTTVATKSNPDVSRYFYKLVSGDRTSNTLTIARNKFWDDAGNLMTGNLTTKSADNGYYSLFINGILQQTSLFTVGASGSQVAVTQAATIPVSAPITFVVTNFAPTSTAANTVTT